MQFWISSRRENRQRDTLVIKTRVLRKVFHKQFCFIRYKTQHLRAVEGRRYSILFTFVENTIGNSPKVPRAKFLESDGLLCFISICKFGCLKNPFAMITSLPILSKKRKILFFTEQLSLIPFYYVQDAYQKNQLETRSDKRQT